MRKIELILILLFLGTLALYSQLPVKGDWTTRLGNDPHQAKDARTLYHKIFHGRLTRLYTHYNFQGQDSGMILHLLYREFSLLFFFIFDEAVYTIECKSSVVTDDTSTSISIWKTCDDMA